MDETVAGMTWPGQLHPEARALLAQFDAAGVQPYDRLSVLEARAVVAGSTRLQGPRIELPSVRDLLVPGRSGRLPVRVYRPEPGQELPLVVYFHGGGFVTGSVAVADRPCRLLARSARCVVASVEYRLAPESPFPAPLEDALDSVRWLAGHAAELGADPGRLVVAGDSAGGNLAAAAVQQLVAGGGPPIAHQLLLYPTLAPTRGSASASLVENGEGYLLTRGSLDWFWDHYLADPADASDPRAAPLLATELGGLPAATIVVPEFDPLRDEGEAYGDRLRAAGVEVEVVRVHGAVHGFWWMAGVLAQAGELTERLGARLRDLLG
ncbi:alpha/beta hydrolase [Geodermatophilus sp. TF02-6]|uniref:alpha/beta hydrolase n=1 Tax=Geodermatophilus sp. TF02-6 TaxID=2250575 RepID=UPI0018F2C065|nr:alpha/beta hydrolase [Geodermatophilus sp. TF02-6]